MLKRYLFFILPIFTVLIGIPFCMQFLHYDLNSSLLTALVFSLLVTLSIWASGRGRQKR
jgi:hypothetical protein